MGTLAWPSHSCTLAMCGHRRRGTHLFLADPRDQGSRRSNKLESFDGYIVCGIGAETETPPSGMSISETSPGTSKWYETERNTEALVKAVMAARPVRGLKDTASRIWSIKASPSPASSETLTTAVNAPHC